MKIDSRFEMDQPSARITIPYNPTRVQILQRALRRVPASGEAIANGGPDLQTARIARAEGLARSTVPTAQSHAADNNSPPAV